MCRWFYAQRPTVPRQTRKARCEVLLLIMAPSYDVENPAADPLLPALDESGDCTTCHATPGGERAAQEVVTGQDLYSQPGVYRGIPEESHDEPSDTKGVVASVATLLFSLPALGALASFK